MMWWNDYWPMPFIGPLVMLAFLALCVTMMFFMMRGMGHGRRELDAMDILKERFARGEITQSEYEERRRVLKS